MMTATFRFKELRLPHGGSIGTRSGDGRDIGWTDVDA